MGPKLGQKLTETPKDFMLRVRLDAETLNDLDDCATKLKIDRSKVVRRGIRLVKKSLEEEKSEVRQIRQDFRTSRT